MAETGAVTEHENYTSFEIEFGNIPRVLMEDFSVKEVVLAESLLTPGLQTGIKAQSYIHNLDENEQVKFWDALKGVTVGIRITRPALELWGYPKTMDVAQTVYRMGGRSATDPNAIDNRKLFNRGVEEISLHACDPTLLNDAATLVSKAWKCTTPSDVTADVLRNCAGAKNLFIESSMPARDYIAENIHPFQVVAQQATAALAAGSDPSFVHFMTYENLGTHHFRSLHEMAKQDPIITLVYNNTGTSWTVPDSIMTYSFPCDFDLLSDILNGVGLAGGTDSSLALWNPATKQMSIFGSQGVGCGIGQGVFKFAMSNMGSAGQQNQCPDFVSSYLLKRQARMGLLERDKVALRLTVPWNPIYNVGKILRIELYNTEDKTLRKLNYGSGNYLISSLVHHLRAGGYSTITMDCVSETVSRGEV